MRPEVQHLVGMGQLPSSASAIPIIQEWQEALENIKPPLSDEEAVALTKLLPNAEDECYGLAWTLIHLIETAPTWPLSHDIEESDNPWIARLRQAAN
jgi:hypothetical protein